MLEEIWNAILPNILEIILTVISLMVSYYVVPCIKDELIPWLKEKRLYSIVKKLVQAVEKMAESGLIEKIDKKEEVVRLLNKKGIVVDDIADAFIESCVKELDIVDSVILEEIIESEEKLIEP
jgi:hypothetical protein